MRKGCQDLSLAERQDIYKLRECGKRIREIARIIHRSPSAVSRELKRGRTRNKSLGYMSSLERAKLSHDAATARRKRRRKRFVVLKNPRVEQYVKKKLKNKWSPQVIAARIKHVMPGECLSHETIYQYIYRHDRTLVQYLIRKGKSRRGNGKGCSRPLREKRDKDKRPISERPETANRRTELGHLETDLIVSPQRKGKKALQVTVDRESRYGKLRLVDNRTADVVRRSLLQAYWNSKPDERRTLTSDNGSEHAHFPELEKVLPGFKVYYCGAYRSWERGTVEAVNGIIRWWFPNGTSFDEVTPQQVQEVEDWYNNRPMLIFDGLTPREVHERELAKSAA